MTMTNDPLVAIIAISLLPALTVPIKGTAEWRYAMRVRERLPHSLPSRTGHADFPHPALHQISPAGREPPVAPGHRVSVSHLGTLGPGHVAWRW